MDRLSRALSLGQNSSNNKNSKKKKESVISENNEKSLKDWKLPASSASDIFYRSGFFSTVKTVEKEIPLSSEEYASFPLFSKNFKRVYLNYYEYLHVGMIQVGLKPTKIGSNISAVICLRDERCLKYDQSVLRMVESSLRDGPIHFSYVPNHCVALSDAHYCFTIDAKTEGTNTMRGDESIILMYRFHYKVTNSPLPLTKNLSLLLTNVAQSNSPSPSYDGEKGAVANARVDWKETAEAHVLKVDVPGLKKEEVKVEVEDGSIKISGERSKEQEESGDKWHCVERSSGKFLRRVALPENAKLDEVKAAMENGVLTVTVPKEDVKNKPQVKVIEISG